jgi:MoaA/NifB/PqqE/SkfB family radical SAM enzyme
MADNKYAHIDDQGHIVLPPEMVEQWGLSLGDRLPVELYEQALQLRRPVTSLRRVYVEITNQCNLSCSTCMRNVWETDSGHMSVEMFEHILEGASSFSPMPEIFIGGYGEPLSNPDCPAMLERAKSLGMHVSLITNGILLNEKILQQLIDMHLDMLWVSLDGASPECYADVRLGNELPKVIENLKRLRSLRFWRYGSSAWAGYPKLGIAFVATRRNIQDLPELIKMGIQLGAVAFSVSNVLAHNQQLQAESLYQRAVNQVSSRNIQQWKPLIQVPRMDVNHDSQQSIIAILKGDYQLTYSGGALHRNVDQCPFVERGSISIRWDGKVSACLPLLHTHKYFLGDRERHSQAHFVGDLQTQALADIWLDPDYVDLRQRLQLFDFSPCAYCNSCEMASVNLEDCYGNKHPSCGGCLWAQGLIRCP